MSLKYNKVVVNKKTIIDLTSDTVTSETLLTGRVAHSSDGSVILGGYEPPSLEISENILDSSGNNVLDSSSSAVKADTGYISLADHAKIVEGLKSLIRQYEIATEQFNYGSPEYLLDSEYAPIDVTPVRI